MRRPLLLIVDDDRESRELYGSYLAMSGYDVCDALDGREAIEKALALKPDLIVLDLWMPRIDGWQTLKTLRSDSATAGTPIIVLTGHDLKDYLRAAALAMGAQSYLTKPCSPGRLGLEIETRLQAFRRSQQTAS
jgi:DNA-binding response OmpR family regulator